MKKLEHTIDGRDPCLALAAGRLLSRPGLSPCCFTRFSFGKKLLEFVDKLLVLGETEPS